MGPAGLVNAVIQCESRTASGMLPVQTRQQRFLRKSNVSCTGEQQEGGRSSVELTRIKKKTKQMPEMCLMATAALWESITGVLKREGEMERWYFTALERAAGGSVCQ